MNPLQRILHRLPEVFTPAKPISDVRFLRGRDLIREQVDQAMQRKGASIVLYGERGVGKSSVAKIVAQFAPGNPCYYAVSRSDTFETVCASVLDYYDVSWRSEGRTTSSAKSRRLQLEIEGIAGGVASQEGVSHEERVLAAARLTP